MKKRLLSSLLALSMMMTITPAYSFAIDDGTDMQETGSVNMLTEAGTEESPTQVNTAEVLTEAVKAGGYIQLTDSIELSNTLSIPKDVTVELDMAGNTLSISSKENVISNNGILIVKNGTIATKNDGKDTAGFAVSNQSGAQLTVEQDADNATKLIGRSGIENYGTVVVYNGTIESYNRNAYWGSADSELTVHDGTFTSPTGSSGMGRAISTEGDVTIYGGSFYAGGSSGAGDNYMNTISMFNGGVLTIQPESGKTVTVTSETDYAVSTSSTNGQTYAKAYIYGGSFACNGSRTDILDFGDKNIEIYGGSFNHEPYSEYLAENHIAVNEDGCYVVKETTGIADVTVDSYEALRDALNGSILEPKNITVSADVIIPVGADLTLQRGYTLTIDNDAALTVNGILSLDGTMTNNGTLTVGTQGFLEYPLNLTNNGTIVGYPTVVGDVCSVSTPMELQWLSCMVEWNNDNIPSTIQVTNDIAMPEDVVFTPIGNSNFYYRSTFDGGNHTISDLLVEVTSEYRGGLFGNVGDVTIKDLIISGASTNSTSSYIGALAGYMSGSCTVSNVHIKDYSVNSPISYGVGGFVGQIWTEDASDRFEFIGCSTENVDVTGYANVGGIWGTSTGSKGTIGIYNCSLNGTVDTINVNGGICGGYGNSAPVEIIGLTHSDLAIKGKTSNTFVAHTTTSANSQEFADSKYEAIQGEDGRWTAYLPPVAQVGEEQYTSLAEAIKNATPGSEVTLLKDIALVDQISIDKDLTLNLNQHTLTNSFESSTPSGEDRFSLLTKGNVTIKNGTYVSNGGVGTRGIGQYSGNLTLQDVTTTCKDINVCNYAEGGKLTISNSTVSGDYAVGSFANKSTVEISKSKLVGETCGLYHNGSYYGLKLTVADTTIEGGNDAVATGDTNDSSGVYISGSTQTTAANGGEDQQAKFTNCIISGGTAVEVKYTDLVLENCNAFTTSTGEPTYEQFNNGSTTAGFSVVATDNSMKPNDPTPGGSVIITDGFYKGMVGLRGLIDQSEEYQNFKETTYTISGGHFTSDPTAYLANGYVAVASDKDGYVYQVVKATNTPAEVVPEDPKVEVELPDHASDADKTLAASISTQLNKLVVDEDIVKAAAGTVASQNTVTVDEGKQALKQENIAVDTGETVTIVIQPYLDVTLTDANSEDQNFTVDITPMYRTVATTNVDDIVVKGEATEVEPANAVVIGEPKELTINKTVEVSIPLPNGFTSDKTLYVHHQKNNVTYVYEGAVKDDTLTFTNPHGFSLFTITAAKPQAKIGDVNYATLQDAINAVENGGTIELLANGSATVSREITFTITGKFKAEITAGSGYKLTQNSDTYTITEKSTSSGGASHPEAGSTSSSSDRYQIDKPSKVENGSIKVSDSKAEKGDTVTITVTPDEGYELDELAVYDEDGDKIDLKDKGDGKYTFEMPKGDVEIEVSFAAISDETLKANFTDVAADAWYADAVQYVYENGLMSGTSETTFSPDLTTTRGMIVTILYRMENEPAVTGTTAFTDVAADQYYANAVAWAAQNGIVSGIDATTFAPNNAITREQMAAILYRYAQFKGYDVSAKADLSVYTDAAQVSTYATDAMAWANGAELITGTSATTLSPAGNATRAQVATILMRFCENIAK